MNLEEYTQCWIRQTEGATVPEPPHEELLTSEDGFAPSPPLPGNLLMRAGPDGRRVTVAVNGEFSLDDSQILRHTLCDALARSRLGVDLDLSGLALADCSLLNVLLALRRHAIAAGKTITVTTASPAAERLLTFTDTYTLFSATRKEADAVAGNPGPQGEDAHAGFLQTEAARAADPAGHRLGTRDPHGFVRPEPRRGMGSAGHGIPAHQHKAAPPGQGRGHHRTGWLFAGSGPAAAHGSRRQNAQGRKSSTSLDPHGHGPDPASGVSPGAFISADL